MATQDTLFSDLPTARPLSQPDGFRYHDHLITEPEQASLVNFLDSLNLQPFEFHGHLGNRRVVSFGLKYNYSRRTVEPASSIPPFLDNLLPRVAAFAGVDPSTIRQIGINQYPAGAGIGWHKDKREFGIVIGLSLLHPATMRFRRPDGQSWQRISHLVQPRSIYLLDGPARTEWEHSIPPVTDLRYSITFRTLANQLRSANV